MNSLDNTFSIVLYVIKGVNNGTRIQSKNEQTSYDR